MSVPNSVREDNSEIQPLVARTLFHGGAHSSPEFLFSDLLQEGVGIGCSLGDLAPRAALRIPFDPGNTSSTQEDQEGSCRGSLGGSILGQ